MVEKGIYCILIITIFKRLIFNALYSIKLLMRVEELFGLKKKNIKKY
jgi:hypothetical protein